ncbi:uncharacterized protein A1O9_08885 [Exophiala aquamarina CBS 119918]|uniref:Bromo domain-containing protein n=1 Tax=Exophiala aquamarina CBS 119918 TaxID=1182545 RepID=A0A072P5W6_9EURO|nr:uncharacterized protein A1O9_08885 [Exophiala aquamarina CBS 119918]KEF55231.1 hypothetical protein A1O9_08885 [Exophiala aquamarina CBS 119918]
MPSLKAYTPYETLAFCQSIARHGLDPAAFEDISLALNANQLIRDGQTYDESRLTAVALQGLCNDLLLAEKQAEIPVVNGDNGTSAVNPKKRKLSTSPPPAENDGLSDEKLFQTLVEKLYAQFRERVIKEIRLDEATYESLQADIVDLEKRVKDEERQQQQARALVDKAQADYDQQKRLEREASKAVQAQASPDPAAAQLQADLAASRPDQTTPKPLAPIPTPPESKASPSSAQSAQQQPIVASRSPAPPASPAPNVLAAKSSAEPASNRPPQPHSAGAAGQHHSPGAYPRALPIPSPQRPNYVPINQQHFQPGPQGHPVPVLSPHPGIPHMPPPTEFPNQKRSGSGSGQGRGSPLPMPPQQQYPAYPGYPQPPWPPQIAPQHQYQQSPPYPNQPYYPPPPNARPGAPYQTPHHPQYQQYPQSAPIHYQGQPNPHKWPPPPPNQPYYPYPNSANVTPVPRSDSRRLQSRGRSSTPWKKRTEQQHHIRTSSPIRPEREVSPLTDTESPTRPSKPRRKSPVKKEQKGDETSHVGQEGLAPRGRQATSTTPSAFAASRSQSIASRTSETQTEQRRRGRSTQKIKAEPPSTPAPIASDSEQQQRSSGRRGRPRTTTASSKPEAQQPTTTNKRKRSPTHDSVTPVLPSPERDLVAHQAAHDSSLVLVSKNFTKTSLLLLNDIVSHKLAGIFAKPLSERDAPGYKDLVLRPQDLKSIKAAISKGGKAVHAAIEAFEDGEGSGEDTPTASTPGAGLGTRVGPMGNGMYSVQTSEDLVPPKGIVNSSQLKMELTRMFANAVMFNPLSSSERGFGRSLRLRKNGGDVILKLEDSVETDSESSSEDSDESPNTEGGIIADAREMFEDMLGRVSKWRELEAERIGNDESSATKGAHPSLATHGSASASARHSSVSSAVNEDEAGGEAVSTPVATSLTGTARKRRRIAET